MFVSLRVLVWVCVRYHTTLKNINRLKGYIWGVIETLWNRRWYNLEHYSINNVMFLAVKNSRIYFNFYEEIILEYDLNNVLSLSLSLISLSLSLSLSLSVYIYIYMYIYVCKFACACMSLCLVPYYPEKYKQVERVYMGGYWNTMKSKMI